MYFVEHSRVLVWEVVDFGKKNLKNKTSPLLENPRSAIISKISIILVKGRKIGTSPQAQKWVVTALLINKIILIYFCGIL